MRREGLARRIADHHADHFELEALAFDRVSSERSDTLFSGHVLSILAFRREPLNTRMEQ